MLAIIGGTLLLGSDLMEGMEKRVVQTPYGDVTCYIDDADDFVLLMRHGPSHKIPPHRINHLANIDALSMLDVDGVVSLNSTGSLNPDIRPGEFLVTDDFVCFWDVPTFLEDDVYHAVVEFDSKLTEELISITKGAGYTVHKGVYVQTSGPRLETPAEIRVLSTFGDVVGMTLASEATLCAEKDIRIASLCSIDNYAQGIKGKVSMDDVFKGAIENQRKVLDVAMQLVRKNSKGKL